ncbi:hypothetical protein DXG01_017170 [Tephrocybe rancida]|nr:hypothetical protein DXG01_017170 [Tephrocybe rancida]
MGYFPFISTRLLALAMPRTYSLSHPTTLTDADDSIVLDDLVRTAEASRLRRRGAMRIDHTGHGHHSHSVFVSVEPGSGTWEDFDYDHAEDRTPYAGSRRTSTRTRTPRANPPPTPTYTLFCGADEPEPAYEPQVNSDPYIPSILPVVSSSSRSKTRSKPAQPKPKPRRTTGCGALLHISATPRRRSSIPSPSSFTWSASASEIQTGSVVSLDASYLSDPTSFRIQHAPCGCVREAVACAACGNFLGTRHAACSVSGTRSCTFSFLPSAVTSSPEYTPPPQDAPPQSYPTLTPSYHSPSPFGSSPYAPSPYPTYPHTYNDPEPPTYPPLLDRLITASPTPLSDAERAAYRARAPVHAQPRYSYGYGTYGYGYGAGSYDPDGDPVDPGSPKTGEGVLAPER